ncbi:glycosyltransferase [Methylocystis sp. ATCC 49242]|uniref:glycosyltransferase n=1 Tax=Methylocystis sp. ATCC 49242 TaxID=622637 RepID=UPI0001F8802A|nr:glycosyltransferase [Methylocystis sp. ATCC 49242]
MSMASVDSFSSASPSLKREDTRPVDRRRALSTELPASVQRRPASAKVPAPRALPVEISFLIAYGVPEEVLRYAAETARRQGVSADAALLAEGLVREDVYYRSLADHLKVAFIDEPVEVAPASVVTARLGYARLRDAACGVQWLFAPVGAEIFRLMSAARNAGGRPLFAVTTRTRFIEAVRRAAPKDVAHVAAHSAEFVDRALCVRGSLRRAPLALATGALAALIASLFAPVKAVALAAALLLAVAFLSSVFLRLAACAARGDIHDRVSSIRDAQLPVYTVVIALYKEASVARQLARAIDRFDYPRAKLDVKFVIEQDDEATAAALRSHAPRAPHEIVVCPEGEPRTKPRALNIAMSLARGSLVCVFDAEDLPDARQLRRAAALFAHLPSDVACLQASLVIDNGALNWMTSLFAMEYAALFDVFNKGLAALGLPLFLGGTSNHFRMEALREIGYWDAFNVTEDADLGLRLARAGYGVRTFSSDTYEEAPAVFRALVKQRTRWFKGWMQTAIVHCRHPLRLLADLGPRRAGAVCAMFVGGFLGPLLGPLLAARLVYDAAFGALFEPQTGFEIICSTLWCFLAISGAVALLWPLILGMYRRKLTAQWRALLCLPLWLAMLSIAAWRALFELWSRPFHWEKTEHGLTMRGALHPAPFASGEEPLLEQEPRA